MWWAAHMRGFDELHTCGGPDHQIYSRFVNLFKQISSYKTHSARTHGPRRNMFRCTMQTDARNKGHICFLMILSWHPINFSNFYALCGRPWHEFNSDHWSPKQCSVTWMYFALVSEICHCHWPRWWVPWARCAFSLSCVDNAHSLSNYSPGLLSTEHLIVAYVEASVAHCCPYFWCHWLLVLHDGFLECPHPIRCGISCATVTLISWLLMLGPRTAEEGYAFVSSSKNRRTKMNGKIPVSTQRDNDTRWSPAAHRVNVE
jgi:hypothetical protein